jgi:hypothetical protein
MRLLNPRIGNFTGRLEGDVVTAQCVEKFGVQFQGTPVWPEDVRDFGNWRSSVTFRLSRMALGLDSPNFSMGQVVHIGSEQTQCHPFALCASARRASIPSMIEFIFWNCFFYDKQRQARRGQIGPRREKAQLTSFDMTRSVVAICSSMYESFGPTMRERGCSPSGTRASMLLHQ